MATESSAIVRLARLAQARPIAEPPSSRETTLVVRRPERRMQEAALLRGVPWMIAAALVVFALVVVMPSPEPGPLRGGPRPVAMPLQESAAEPLVESLQERKSAGDGEIETEIDERGGREGGGPSGGEQGSAREGAAASENGEDSASGGGEARRRRRGRARSQVAGLGTLQVGSKPPCHIVIDGRDTGLTTPQRSIRLRPGRHRIGLENVDHGIDERLVVRIRDGRTTKVIRDLTDHL